jgi:transcriptional regulator with XRE-family HTH domain
MFSTPLSELKDLGWTGAELAKRLGVRQATVSAWRTGKREVPAYVPEYLRLAVWIHAQGWRVP